MKLVFAAAWFVFWVGVSACLSYLAHEDITPVILISICCGTIAGVGAVLIADA